MGVRARNVQSLIQLFLLSVMVANRLGLEKPSSSTSVRALACCPCLLFVLRLSGIGQSFPKWPYSSQLKQRRVSSLFPGGGSARVVGCACPLVGGSPLPLPSQLVPRCPLWRWACCPPLLPRPYPLPTLPAPLPLPLMAMIRRRLKKKRPQGRALVPPGSSSFSPKASGFGRDVRRMDSWYVFLFGIHRLTSLKEEDQWPNGHCPPW